MHEGDKLYVRNAAGRVFGPIGMERLKEWVRDGRVEPQAGISADLKNWILAPLVGELEMDCVIENNPGQFYGPTHRAVAEDLRKSGSLSRDARVYRDRSVSQSDCAAAVAARDAAIAARDALAAERDKLLSERASFAAARDAAAAERDALLSEKDTLSAERDALVSEKDALSAELADVKAKLEKLETLPAREWKAEVVEPEVVSGEPPPRTAREIFGVAEQPPPPQAPRAASSPFPSGNATAMAALEAQARAELARMGASGKNIFKFMKK